MLYMNVGIASRRFRFTIQTSERTSSYFNIRGQVWSVVMEMQLTSNIKGNINHTRKSTQLMFPLTTKYANSNDINPELQSIAFGTKMIQSCYIANVFVLNNVQVFEFATFADLFLFRQRVA